LAKTIRRRLKEVKIDKLKWFSSEIQDDASLKMTDGSNYKRSLWNQLYARAIWSVCC
jgi:hypothetical protein